MAITEAARHQLYVRLEQALGTEEATTLMEHLPPVGWADVATKRDLDHLGSELRGEMRVLDANLRTALADGLRVQTFAILGGGSVLVGLGTVLSRVLT